MMFFIVLLLLFFYFKQSWNPSKYGFIIAALDSLCYIGLNMHMGYFIANIFHLR